MSSYQNAVRVIVRVAADWALATTGADSKVAEIVCILIVVHGQTDAQFATSVTALLHHFRESFIPTTLTVMLFQFEFLHFYHPLDYMLLPLPPATLPVI